MSKSPLTVFSLQLNKANARNCGVSFAVWGFLKLVMPLHVIWQNISVDWPSWLMRSGKIYFMGISHLFPGWVRRRLMLFSHILVSRKIESWWKPYWHQACDRRPPRLFP